MERQQLAAEKKQKEEAATKVQAIYRGNTARKELADRQPSRDAKEKTDLPQSASDKQATAEAPGVEKTNATQQEQEKAATKIQAIQRGRAARKDAAAKKEGSFRIPTSRDAKEKTDLPQSASDKQATAEALGVEKPNATQQEQEKAATKIQAIQRGRAARKDAAAKKEGSFRIPTSRDAKEKTDLPQSASDKQATAEALGVEKPNATQQEQEKSATKIQAIQRGRAARKDAAEKETGVPGPEALKEEAAIAHEAAGVAAAQALAASNQRMEAEAELEAAARRRAETEAACAEVKEKVLAEESRAAAAAAAQLQEEAELRRLLQQSEEMEEAARRAVAMREDLRARQRRAEELLAECREEELRTEQLEAQAQARRARQEAQPSPASADKQEPGPEVSVPEATEAKGHPAAEQERAEAATKIQSLQRGRKARSETGKKGKAPPKKANIQVSVGGMNMGV
ncbi:ASPM [Symbiodinium natans]|uniref:ASPM protein n=1 Tax=Symbiodinium natans TaxID=878477 RepID=A0A812TFM4_9DINO|nr:ASPM [Symbiodinium natans]